MPHFYDSIPDPFASLSMEDAVESYRDGAGLLTPAVEDLTNGQLNEFPVPGTWSIRQIVIHLADTDQVASYRMKRIIAEDRPVLDSYDENAFVEKLRYQNLDAWNACRLFAVNRIMTADVLRQLKTDDFERCAQHPEIGEITLGKFVRIYAFHIHHHLDFINRKREMILAKEG